MRKLALTSLGIAAIALVAIAVRDARSATLIVPPSAVALGV